MLKNYFKIAWRNLWKSKLFSFINVFGLAVGVAAFWLILLFVGYELSFDRFHKKAERIYRVVQHAAWDNQELDVAITSAPFAPALVNDYPEIEAAVRVNSEGGGVMSYEKNQMVVNDAFFVDSNFFKVFSFEFLHGNPGVSLAKPQSIVLTESLAEKLFGDPSIALGKTIHFTNNFENVVTGVIKDVPINSHLNFSALRSFPANYTNGWQNFDIYTYILLNENSDIEHLESKLPQFFEKHLLSEMGEVDYKLELQPLTSIHLHSSLDYEIGANGDINTIYIFLAAAILILIIAAINYMNLTAARSSLRVREVGVRKVIGSTKTQLIAMFFCEAFVVSFIAILLALLFAELALPYVKGISGVEISVRQFGFAKTVLMFFVVLLLIVVFCGFYPAFFLSGFKTMSSLKGQLGNINSNIAIRKSMVVFQFVIATIMVLGSWIIYVQMQYVSQKDLGFNKEQVLTFHLSSKQAREKMDVLKATLEQNSSIKAVSVASNPIGNNNIGGRGYYIEQGDGEMPSSTQIFYNFEVDENFLNTLEINLIEGRNFSLDHAAEHSEAVLVNEALVKNAGWKNPLGKRIKYHTEDGNIAEVSVVGVVKDFHIYSLQHALTPLVIHRILPDDMDNVYVRIQPGDAKETLSYIETAYNEIESAPFRFQFLDQNFSQQYQSEQRQGKLLLVFTLLAVFLALLGLFGLTAFSAEQKNKEIGIRKVLGASIFSLVGLLSKDFMKLILVAFIIATPFAWFAINKWLQYFAYHIELSWTAFAITGIGITFIALTTVSYQALKAALANPIDALKDE